MYTIEKNYDEAQGKWQIAIAGEIDISNAHLLKAELEASYEKQKADISIDVSGLKYVDSTGLGVIISLYGKMQKDSKKLTLVNPRDNVKKLLKITQFDKVLS